MALSQQSAKYKESIAGKFLDAKFTQSQVDVLVAVLTDIHSDVAELKADVAELKAATNQILQIVLAIKNGN